MRALGVPAVIVDARRAKAALSCRLNKTDANDAEGLAQLARTGWYREVAAKRPETRLTRSLLLAHGQLSKQRRDLENQVRGLSAWRWARWRGPASRRGCGNWSGASRAWRTRSIRC